MYIKELQPTVPVLKAGVLCFLCGFVSLVFCCYYTRLLGYMYIWVAWLPFLHTLASVVCFSHVVHTVCIHVHVHVHVANVRCAVLSNAIVQLIPDDNIIVVVISLSAEQCQGGRKL